ncbi:Phospholipase C [Tulasnella sp. 419]|nr:Phospholipase C [Tulasnella sp. 419]
MAQQLDISQTPSPYSQTAYESYVTKESKGTKLKIKVDDKKETFAKKIQRQARAISDSFFSRGDNNHGRIYDSPVTDKFPKLPAALNETDGPSNTATSNLQPPVQTRRVASHPSTSALPASLSTTSDQATLIHQFTEDDVSKSDAIVNKGSVNANLVEEIKVPALLQQGTPMLKVSKSKLSKSKKFHIDPDQGLILWDSKKGGIVAIENIREMRFGSDARTTRQECNLPAEMETRWITIVYMLDGNYKNLHMVAPTQDVFQLWNSALTKLYSIRKEMMNGFGTDVESKRWAMWEKQYWKGADANQDGKLSFQEVEIMIARLNLRMPKELLYKYLEQVDVNKSGCLDFEEFRKFVGILKARPEVDKIYNEISRDGKLDYPAFEQFMKDTQKCALGPSEMKQLWEHFVPSTTGQEGSSQVMTLDAFTSFLVSSHNAASTDYHRGIYQDMTKPLSEYYISSSHNTYLVGNQLIGVSTIEGYIRALLQGCRCVELDVYDGDREPVIRHGNTLTTNVPLRQVAQAIAKYAFIASPYPVIVSTEMHCGVRQQGIFAEIFREEFGDALVTDHLPDRVHERESGIKELPSPEQLKGRILLKAKNQYLTNEKEAEGDDDESSEAEDEASKSAVARLARRVSRNVTRRMSRKPRIRRTVSRTESTGGDLHSSPPPSPQSHRRQRVSMEQHQQVVKMSPELFQLLVYTVGISFRGFDQQYDVEHLFSLSEKKAKSILKVNAHVLVDHSRTHVVRVYPQGLRVKSTNFEPNRFWAMGAQLVAINWQTFDMGFALNYAMFQRNGQAGYVLKPDALRLHNGSHTLGERSRHVLDVTIISAQQLPRPKDDLGNEIVDKSIVDPLVRVTLHVPDWSSSFVTTVKDDSKQPDTRGVQSQRTVTQRTSVVKNNGFNPVWDETLSLQYELLGGMSDLVFARFEVKERDGNEERLIGMYCISLGSLLMGYRHLPLHDQQMSQYLFASLFVKISIRDL